MPAHSLAGEPRPGLDGGPPLERRQIAAEVAELGEAPFDVSACTFALPNLLSRQG